MSGESGQILVFNHEVLEALPTDAFTFLETRGGKKRSPNGFGNKMRDWCDQGGLAEAGAPPHENMAVTGHTTLAEVTRYTRDVDRPNIADGAITRLK